MKFTLHDLILELDAEKTRRFYAETDASDECDCAGCRNYRLAVPRFPAEVADIFRRLGIDVGKPAEIIPWSAEEGGRAMHYGGFYHLCGRLIRGGHYTVTDGFSVSFTEDVSLPETGLPSPALQMEIDFHGVPWLLDEENPY